jgi:hypothetical protein
MKNLITKFMKVAFLAIILALGLNAMAKAQTLDTVCAKSNEYYSVSSDLMGSTFDWIVSVGGAINFGQGTDSITIDWIVSDGGAINFGQGTDSITIDWGNTAGLYNLKVVETSADGCLGDTMSLDIQVVNKPKGAMAGDNTLCHNEESDITMELTGIAPWEFTYAKNGADTTISGITTTPYSFTHTNSTNTSGGSTSTAYTIGVVNDKYCTNVGTGSATVTNNPKPQTSSIRRR